MAAKKYITHNKEKYLIKRFLFMEDESICQRNPWFIRSLLEYFFGLSLGVVGQNIFAIIQEDATVLCNRIRLIGSLKNSI